MKNSQLSSRSHAFGQIKCLKKRSFLIIQTHIKQPSARESCVKYPASIRSRSVPRRKNINEADINAFLKFVEHSFWILLDDTSGRSVDVRRKLFDLISALKKVDLTLEHHQNYLYARLIDIQALLEMCPIDTAHPTFRCQKTHRSMRDMLWILSDNNGTCFRCETFNTLDTAVKDVIQHLQQQGASVKACPKRDLFPEDCAEHEDLKFHRIVVKYGLKNYTAVGLANALWSLLNWPETRDTCRHRSMFSSLWFLAFEDEVVDCDIICLKHGRTKSIIRALLKDGAMKDYQHFEEQAEKFFKTAPTEVLEWFVHEVLEHSRIASEHISKSFLRFASVSSIVFRLGRVFGGFGRVTTSCDEVLLERLCKAGAPVNSYDGVQQRSLLGKAVFSGNVKAVKSLLQHGASLRSEELDLLLETSSNTVTWLLQKSGMLQFPTKAHESRSMPYGDEKAQLLEEARSTPRSLLDVSAANIRKALREGAVCQGSSIIPAAQRLPLPIKLINYVLLRHLDAHETECQAEPMTPGRSLLDSMRHRLSILTLDFDLISDT